ncbi:MAG TPA: S9 family peptidase [Chitinophagaceae bacterium]
MKPIFLFAAVLFITQLSAQERMTPELMLKLGRVSGIGLSKDKQYVVYSVSTPDMQENKSRRQVFALPLKGGEPVVITNADSATGDPKISPDGTRIIYTEEVKLKNVFGKDFYPELQKSNVQIYDYLNYRHWDEWEDGKFGHVFLAPYNNGVKGEAKDLMAGEPFDCPQKPFGGSEDYTWSPDGKKVVYVTKKKFGTAYAVSTNTDLYEYDLANGTTRNLTETNKGYDVSPAYSKTGILAWMQMKRDGYEADKQDLVAMTPMGNLVNLTGHRDDIHVEGFRWSEDGRNLYFLAPVNGTMMLFEVDYTGNTMKLPEVRQISKGDFDINNMLGQDGDQLYVTRTDFNHAAEVYSINTRSGEMKQLTHVNDAIYNSISLPRTERRWVTTTDNKKMLVWVVYPPGFNPKMKYRTLLLCQGGPQSPVTQSYSFRWNPSLMASNDYIVVYPARRGMPGFGTKWNEQVSKDWGGQVLKDYLSAIDAVSKEPYVDKTRIGCVGASFGGYSVFALAGIHNNRFKTFISHDGIYDFRSMYASTEEMFFENWEKGGPYWDKKNAVAQRSFAASPSNLVEKWNTPIMIVHGGRDYRVPVEQSMQAFTAAQLRGIKSRFLYFPEENHWVLAPQNALVWQREFYKWLDETLK